MNQIKKQIKIGLSYKITIPICLFISLLCFQIARPAIYDDQNYFFAVILSFLCLYFFCFLPTMVILLGILPMNKFTIESEKGLDVNQQAINTQNRKESYAVKISQVISSLPAAIISLVSWHGYGNFTLVLFVVVLIVMVALSICLNLFEIPIQNKMKRKPKI